MCLSGLRSTLKDVESNTYPALSLVEKREV